MKKNKKKVGESKYCSTFALQATHICMCLLQYVKYKFR